VEASSFTATTRSAEEGPSAKHQGPNACLWDLRRPSPPGAWSSWRNAPFEQPGDFLSLGGGFASLTFMARCHPPRMKPLFHRNVHRTVPPRKMKHLFHRNLQHVPRGWRAASRSNHQPGTSGETKPRGFSARTDGIAIRTLCSVVGPMNSPGSRDTLSVRRTGESASSALALLAYRVDLVPPGLDLCS
jgi:hypothetical protein